MIKLFFILIGLALIAGFFSCKQKLQVRYVGELQSRKSYAAIQFMNVSEDSINTYIEKERSSEPWLYSSADSVLERLFQKAGFIKDSKFLLTKFQALADTLSKTSFVTKKGISLPLEFYSDTINGIIHFRVEGRNKKVDIDTKSHNLQQLDYAFLDIIPGGNKELVYLDDYYIMNGDNFDLRVYEIITE